MDSTNPSQPITTARNFMSTHPFNGLIYVEDGKEEETLLPLCSLWSFSGFIQNFNGDFFQCQFLFSCPSTSIIWDLLREIGENSSAVTAGLMNCKNAAIKSKKTLEKGKEYVQKAAYATLNMLKNQESMVTRGDLGAELQIEEVPLLQRLMERMMSFHPANKGAHVLNLG